MLALYPLVPVAHHRLAGPDSPAHSDENQRLLEESLAEQRQENRRQVRALLNQPQRFRATPDGFQLALAPADVEWLLQVLNDVRVGSWLALGEPESGEEPKLTEQNAGSLLALEVCGRFQSLLLAALGVREAPDWAG